MPSGLRVRSSCSQRYAVTWAIPTVQELDARIQQKLVRIELAKRLGTSSLGAMRLITGFLPTLTEFGVNVKGLFFCVFGFGVSILLSAAACTTAIGGIDPLVIAGKRTYDRATDSTVIAAAGCFAGALINFIYYAVVRSVLIP